MQPTPITASFNGYSLQNAYFHSQIIQHTEMPNRDLQLEPKARADGFNIVNAKFTQKIIEIDGKLSTTDGATLASKIDEMKLNLNGISGNLIIDYGSTQRLYFCTVSKIELPEDFYNINNVPYKITFTCADPFGYTTNSGIASQTGATSLLNDTILTVSGSINSDPVVYLTVNSATNMNLVTFSNEYTGENIVITKPMAANFNTADQLIINCRTKQVQINGSGLDYTGRFPTMNPPTAQLRIAITATSANYNLIYRYLPSYL